MSLRLRTFLWAVVAGCCLVAQGVSAQQGPTTADLKKDIQALQASLTAMQQDLQAIKTLLLTRAPAPPAQAGPENVILDIGSRPVKGNASARLTLVEFSDYQCPFCGRYVSDTYPQLAKEYIETGKVRQVFMDFPLESIHKFAFKSAEVARCAGEQGKYWEMHDQLFANQKALGNWTPYAEAVGLKMDQFDSCLASGKFADEIRKDFRQGQTAGVSGTPGFFLALTDPASTRVKTLRFMKGAQPYAAFKAQIDGVLNSLEAETGKKP